MYHQALSQQQDFLNLLSSTNMYCGGATDLFDSTLLSPQEPSTRSPTPTPCPPLFAPTQQQFDSSTSAVISASSYCWAISGAEPGILPSSVDEQNELMVAGPPQSLPLSCSSSTATAAGAAIVTTPSLAAGLFVSLDSDYTNPTEFGQGFFHVPTEYFPPPSTSPPAPENGLPTDPEHLYQLNNIYRRHTMGNYYRPQAVSHHAYSSSTAASSQTSVSDLITPSITPADYHHHQRHVQQQHPPATIGQRKRRANDKDDASELQVDAQLEFPAKRSKKLPGFGSNGCGTAIGLPDYSSHQQRHQQEQQQDQLLVPQPTPPPPHHHHHHQHHPLFLQQQQHQHYPSDTLHSNPSAVPRRQKLRYEGDEYTPKWVRFQGQLKEGYCDHCKPGKWLQLKNSAYWYHKQFFHGISSVSGKRFAKPLEQRASENDGIEGLCHQCHKFVPICNAKRKTSVLWYRHAHKCHIYDKPKPRMQTPAGKRNSKS